MKKAILKSTDAAKQRAYRDRQKKDGVPTAYMVAMATFRILLSRDGPQRRRVRGRVEDLVSEYLVRRHPGLTIRGVEHRYDEMVEEAIRIRKSGWFDTDMRNGDTDESSASPPVTPSNGVTE